MPLFFIFSLALLLFLPSTSPSEFWNGCSFNGEVLSCASNSPVAVLDNDCLPVQPIHTTISLPYEASPLSADFHHKFFPQAFPVEINTCLAPSMGGIWAAVIPVERARRSQLTEIWSSGFSKFRSFQSRFPSPVHLITTRPFSSTP